MIDRVDPTNFQETLEHLSDDVRSLETVCMQMFQAFGKADSPFAGRTTLSLNKITHDLELAQEKSENATQKLQLLQELVRTSALITSSLEVNQVLEEVIDTIITLTGAERAYLMLHDKASDELTIEVARNWDHETLSKETVSFSRGVVKTVIEQEKPILTANAQVDERFQIMKSVFKYDLKSILCMPLTLRGEIIGVLYADSCTNQVNYSPDNLKLLMVFANQAAIAIENAQLFEQVKADLETAQREVHRLRIQKATLASNDVLPTIVETVAQVLDLPYVAIALKHDDQFVISAKYGLPREDLLRLPLVYQTKTVGELILASRTPDEPFTPADRYLLDELTRQAGIAVHAARLSADLQRSRERLVTTREEERRRLRRDLHDGLGPVLASLMLKLDATRNLLKHDPVAADTLLVELKTQVQSAITDIRRLVYELRPPALDELGLISALRENIMQYNHDNTLRVSFEVPNRLPSLSAALEVAAYRITLEALTNVTRHAQAHNCHIRFTLDDALCLEITDDGYGLAAEHRAGVGITSMRERAAELGGSCVIKSNERGTSVIARLPLSTK
ncbi:MAG: GAF domain-containing protein [Chloroflexota bacterium]